MRQEYKLENFLFFLLKKSVSRKKMKNMPLHYTVHHKFANLFLYMKYFINTKEIVCLFFLQ